MNRVFFACALAAALIAPALAADDKTLDAPPPGLTPTTVTLGRILKAHDAATGRLMRGTLETRQETWTFTRAGLPGTETLLRSGSDYRSHIVTGPLSQDYGQLLGHGWHRFPTGVVSAVQSPDSTSFEMLLLMQNLEEAGDPKNDVTVLGEVQSPVPAYVLAIKTTGAKHPDFAFYDKTTGLINRFETVSDERRMTFTYDDYRTTKDLTQPWHVHFTDGTAALDDDFVRRSLTIGEPIDPKQFAPPQSTFGFEYYNGHQSLPVKIFSGWFSPTIVVRLNVAGRGLDFSISAAQPQSYIDFDVAQQLGLPAYGQTTHADGDSVPYDSIVPQADLGGLLLRNWPVHVTPFNYHLNDETKVVGILGYDVLSSGIFKIDYVNGTLDIYPPKTFDGTLPDALKDAYQLPISFDDGFPFFQGTIAEHSTGNILFDNDFDFSFVSGNFTNQYPDAITDLDTGKPHATAMVPFADSKGFGKSVHVWRGNVPDLKWGPAHFINFHIIASDYPVDFDGHDVDAVMGGDLLQFYDVYLDYPHARVFLKPNKMFFKAFKVETEQ